MKFYTCFLVVLTGLLYCANLQAQTPDMEKNSLSSFQQTRPNLSNGGEAGTMVVIFPLMDTTARLMLSNMPIMANNNIAFSLSLMNITGEILYQHQGQLQAAKNSPIPIPLYIPNGSYQLLIETPDTTILYPINLNKLE